MTQFFEYLLHKRLPLQHWPQRSYLFLSNFCPVQPPELLIPFLRCTVKTFLLPSLYLLFLMPSSFFSSHCTAWQLQIRNALFPFNTCFLSTQLQKLSSSDTRHFVLLGQRRKDKGDQMTERYVCCQIMFLKFSFHNV